MVNDYFSIFIILHYFIQYEYSYSNALQTDFFSFFFSICFFILYMRINVTTVATQRKRIRRLSAVKFPQRFYTDYHRRRPHVPSVQINLTSIDIFVRFFLFFYVKYLMLKNTIFEYHNNPKQLRVLSILEGHNNWRSSPGLNHA